MQLDTWRILPRPGGSFHFGRHGLGQEETALTFSSDRLFAALVAYIALNHPDQLGELVTPDEKSPLVLTSAFPWVHGIRLFPTVLLPSSAGHNDNLKDLKRVTFVSESIFRQMLAGNPLKALFHPEHTAQGGNVLLTAEELADLSAKFATRAQKKNGTKKSATLPSFWTSGLRPRVALDRITNASNLFFTGGVTFAPGCGLWFGIHWVDPNSPLKNTLPSLLAGLGDAGLGGDRSAGYGVCTFEADNPLNLPDPTPGDYWTNLSRYIPTKDEIDALTANHAGYSLIRVGGHLTSNSSMGVRRKAINMIEEGALLGAAQDAVVGRLENVQPTFENNNPISHPVWRNGQTIAVGVTLNGGNQ